MARILAFTDSHGEAAALEGILNLARREPYDLVLCAGDISYFGGSYDLFVRGLKELGKPVHFVTGNHDTNTVTRDLSEHHGHMINIVDRLVQAAEVRILGLPEDRSYWPGGKSDSEVLNRFLILEGTGDRVGPPRPGRALSALEDHPPGYTSGVS